MCCFVPLDGPPCCVKRPEAHAWVYPAFDKAVVLLNPIIQVLDWS